MRIVRVDCGRDPREPDTRVVSDAVRLFVFRLQAEGFVLELTDEGCVCMTPGQHVTADDRAHLTAYFHEIRDVLLTEGV